MFAIVTLSAPSTKMPFCAGLPSGVFAPLPSRTTSSGFVPRPTIFRLSFVSLTIAPST
jgi:hypothetical protein